ncbi:MAG: hypothetical protein JMDDDDMK_02965 [Acidobacteria bacterium]|nr:hypothetical protein [Acidobacteriota bacterium]
MHGVEHLVNVLVAAINGEQALGQVVGAEAEIIGFTRQRFGHDHGGGRFDHHADLYVFGVRDVFGAQVALDFGDDLFGAAHFVEI